MPIREAAYADLVPASKVLAAAFKDESLHGPWFHPYRREFPDDMYLYFLQKLRLEWAAGTSSPDKRIWVSVEDSSSRITGVAVWERKRKSPTPPTWSQTLAVRAAAGYNYLESFVYPNRAAEPANLNILADTEKYIKHHWSGTRAEGWYLDLIGVDPTAGGKRYGRQLVGWGLEQARKDGVGASLVAAEGKEKFYRACGFDVTAGMCGDEGGEENLIRKVGGGAIMFWDGGIAPEGIKKYGEI
jgi:GNAT superfamily N-acetyltransferase